MRNPSDPLAELHDLAGHDGQAAGCPACALAAKAGREAATRARADRRARHQAVDRLLEALR